jgi:uncharacterized protein
MGARIYFPSLDCIFQLDVAQRRPLTIGWSDRGSRLRWAKEGIDDLDKSVSFVAGATPRRSTSSLGPLRTHTRYLPSCNRSRVYAYSMHMDIEWDADKAVANFKKHGVRFEEAATSLLDPQALAQEDADSEGEARWVLIGMSASARLLTVVYTLRNENRIRLISARKATRKESANYA